jgi:hypothetical protein
MTRARARFAILPGVAEIRYNRGDAPCRGPPQRVRDDQEFHQVVIGRKRRRLNHEHVGAADIFLDFDEDFHVRKAADDSLGGRKMQPVGDFLRQHRIGIAGNELDGAVFGRHRGFSPRLAGYNVQHIAIPTK